LKLSSETKELIAFTSAILLVVLAFSYYFFNIAGMKVVLGIVLMSLPFYLILNTFSFKEGEKAVFSILMGVTLFPSLAYLIGLLISFKSAIAITFIIFMAAAAVAWRFRKQK